MRNLRDLQSLLYVGLYAGLIAWQWLTGFSWPLYGLLLFITVGLQIIHHNHVHLGIWHSRKLNRWTSATLSLLSGVPSAMMCLGHIQNHHVHKHGPHDVTRTYRFGGDHNHVWGYLLHPFHALAVLLPMAWREVKRMPRTRLSRQLPGQVGLILVTWLVLAVIDWRNLVLLVWLPQAFGVHWLLGANYFQHAHCDDASDVNYARNFTGAINWFWFNIGFHTAHHEYPRAHWSTLRALHYEKFQHVDPRLNNQSFGVYLLQTFVVGTLAPAVRGKSLRAAREAGGRGG